MNTSRPTGVISFEQVARSKRRLVGLRQEPDVPDDSGENQWPSPSGAVSHARAPNHLETVVRSVRLRDLPGLVRMSTVYRLNQPEILVRGYSVTRDALRSISPIGRSRPRMFVASVEDEPVGFVQFQTALPDRRWHVIALGTATGVYDSSPVEDMLVRHAITTAGLRGVKRLYARAASGTDLVNSFCRIGFAPFATETVFVAESVQNQGLIVPIRQQEPTDTWAIHQLYNATAPRQVQYAEALTSHRWELSGFDELSGSARRMGWLVDNDHTIAAYARVTSGKHAQMLELLYQPDGFDSLGALIDSVLKRIQSTHATGRLYCVLRGYQSEAAKELEARGFEPILEQDLLVKYTTATARAAQLEPLAQPSEVTERLPKRVPSFLQQKPSDETAG